MISSDPDNSIGKLFVCRDPEPSIGRYMIAEDEAQKIINADVLAEYSIAYAPGGPLFLDCTDVHGSDFYFIVIDT